MPLPSLLAVFAHPDDESLTSGGVLARHAASGARTAVVTATWAEGTRRSGELAQALRILGAGEPRMLGYADARVPESAPGAPRFCDAPLDEVVGRLVRHVREFRPEIVITHDAYGNLSGHPDHVHAHRVTVLAVQAAGWGRLYPETGAAWESVDTTLARSVGSSAGPSRVDRHGQRDARRPSALRGLPRRRRPLQDHLPQHRHQPGGRGPLDRPRRTRPARRGPVRRSGPVLPGHRTRFRGAVCGRRSAPPPNCAARTSP